MTYDAARVGPNTDVQLGENAPKLNPRLVEELVHAIAACEQSPLVPAVVTGVAGGARLLLNTNVTPDTCCAEIEALKRACRMALMSQFNLSNPLSERSRRDRLSFLFCFHG